MTPLEAFLRNKKVWTKFKRNVKDQRYSHKTFLEELLVMRCVYRAIDTAFAWADTTERYRFWADLYEEAGGEHRPGDYE